MDEDILVEIIEEKLGVVVSGEKATEFMDCIDATKGQMSFVDTTKPTKIQVVVEKPDLSICCEKPIESRKLSGSAGHVGYYCTGCERYRTV